MTENLNDPDKWREIAEQKEKEWKHVTEQRINVLEKTCQEKELQLKEEREKFYKLKEDFKYNLRLLEQRDNELDKYDATFSDLKSQLNVKTAEVSECKIQVDEIKTQLNCEIKSREELQLHYQTRLREKQAEVDTYRNTKDGEFQEERKEFESFKRKLQRQLTQVEEEMDAQKRELTADFEEAMRKREHDFRLQSDEMNAKLLEYELKAKLLGKELDLVRSAQEKNSQEFEHVENNHRALEKKLKEKDWELQDMKAMKDASISDLENQLQQKHTAMKRLQEDFNRKHTEMDKLCKEKEAALSTTKDAFNEREAELQGEIRDLSAKLEDSNVEIRRLNWSIQDLEKEKNSFIEKLQAQSQQLKDKYDKQVVEVSRNQVDKDIQIQNLRETEQKLKMEIIQRKEDIERYKKELSTAVERESSLERSKTQMELDWQRRYDDLERQQYERSEDLVKKLTRSKDEALAEVKETQRELQKREKLIQVLQSDKHLAYATLKKHDIPLDRSIKIEVPDPALPDEMLKLQQQNDNLKLVIKEMRSQMEQLGHELPDINLDSPKETSCSTDYVKELEKQCRELRQRNRELEESADVTQRFGRAAPTIPTNQNQVLTEVKDNLMVKNHIQSLNEIIGALRGEKVELSAQLKKHQANVLYKEKSIENCKKELREKQVEIDKVQYELGAVSRRSQTELSSLRQKVSELELQLVEARKEADEYYRSNLDSNMQVTSLGQELSSLKLQLSEKRPGINYGAQELLIQQLQDEIMNLKQQGAEFSGTDSVEGNQGSVQVRALQQKLKNAAKKIMELAKEKQQLIEMGNKLRAELKTAGIESSGSKPLKQLLPSNRNNSSSHVTSSQPHSDEFSNKLNQLEKLQYQLTRQELQYAQKYQRTGPGNDLIKSENSDYRPPSILKKSQPVRDSTDTEVDVRASVNTEGGETVISQRSVPGTSRSQLLMSMSSMGGESLQEIWKMLDEGRLSPTPRQSSPSRLQFQEECSDSSESKTDNLYLAGKQTGQQRNKLAKHLSPKASGRVIKKIPHKQLNVRNYNHRDDRVTR